VRQTITITLFFASLMPVSARAQNAGSSAATLGRDVARGPIADQPVDNGIVLPQAGLPVEPMPQNALDGIFVGAINIDGTKQIAPEVFAPVVESFVGKRVSAPELQQMARSIANRARDQGYIFASAMVPEQSVRLGIVNVILDEGAVDEVRIIGSNNRRLRKILQKIAGGAVRKQDVERQLLLAGDLPGISIASTSYLRENGQGVLIIEVVEDRARGSVGLDNYGSKGFGPARARLQLDLTGLLDDGDTLTTQVLATPAQPKELAYVSARYSMTLGVDGTQLGVAAAAGRTQPGNSGGSVVGRSRYVAVFGSHPVVRANNASLWVNAEIAYLNVEQDLLGLRVQRDDIVTVTLAGSGNIRLAHGRLSGGIGVVQGLGVLGATGRDDPLASRLDVSGKFTKGVLWLNWTGDIAHKLSLRLAANGQLASRSLLAAQELGLGGPGYGRGYDFSERFGDSGILGLVELRRTFDDPLPGVRSAQLYGFVDGGYVTNLDSGYGGGTLLSGGGGVRASVGKADLALEAAFPINTPRFESGDKSPRINVSVGYNF
jgi:hemolysin activation/secretion protein